MDPLKIIDKYYPEENELKHILLVHSKDVANKALDMARKHPELGLDLNFIEEAAMLHDIGIFLTDASGICCFGSHPYICHGYLGQNWWQPKAIRGTHGCVSGIPGPDSPWLILSHSSFRYLTGTCSPKPLKNS